MRTIVTISDRAFGNAAPGINVVQGRLNQKTDQSKGSKVIYKKGLSKPLSALANVADIRA